MKRTLPLALWSAQAFSLSGLGYLRNYDPIKQYFCLLPYNNTSRPLIVPQEYLIHYDDFLLPCNIPTQIVKPTQATSTFGIKFFNKLLEFLRHHHHRVCTSKVSRCIYLCMPKTGVSNININRMWYCHFERCSVKSFTLLRNPRS